MDPTWLYYALSTIAQCAAALAALIGFLGLWQLDRLREIRREIECEMIAVVLQMIGRAGDYIRLRGRAHFRQRARDFVDRLRSPPNPWVTTEEGKTIDEEAKQIIATVLSPLLMRYEALGGRQQLLLWVLRVFLVVTLATLGAAVVGFLYVDQALAWGWTPGLLWIAGGWLAGGPIIVVWVAAKLPRARGMATIRRKMGHLLSGPRQLGGTAAPPDRCLYLIH